MFVQLSLILNVCCQSVIYLSAAANHDTAECSGYITSLLSAGLYFAMYKI